MTTHQLCISWTRPASSWSHPRKERQRPQPPGSCWVGQPRWAAELSRTVAFLGIDFEFRPKKVMWNSPNCPKTGDLCSKKWDGCGSWRNVKRFGYQIITCQKKKHFSGGLPPRNQPGFINAGLTLHGLGKNQPRCSLNQEVWIYSIYEGEAAEKEGKNQSFKRNFDLDP